MRFSHLISTVDTHTEGEPTRIALSGFPALRGATMSEKQNDLRARFDRLRRTLMLEPRGHDGMFGALLLPPTKQEADLAIVFMDAAGYLSMCGHGVIGAVTAAIEMGLANPSANGELVVETPAGLVRSRATLRNGVVDQVTFENTPAFVWKGEVPVPLDGRNVEVDIAFGGNFYAIISEDELRVPLESAHLGQLAALSLELRARINDRYAVVHPDMPHIRGVTSVQIIGPPRNPRAHGRNVVIFGQGSIDRCPCGTGTCARMAVLHEQGNLGLGEDFINEGILGGSFTGRLLRETTVGDVKAVVPEVTGKAYITGFHEFVIDPDDPYAFGFLLSGA